MNILLDTHVALWAITDNPNLSDKARKLILAQSSTVWISSVSVWEISIKYSLGRCGVPIPGRDAMQYFRQAGYRFLSIEPEHAVAVEELPNYHQDPFDRLLVAQTLVEPMRLITHDKLVASYNDTIIHV